MNKAFLPYLADPQTREPLELHVEAATGDEVVEGRLCSASNTYPITRGIPRFVQAQQYTESFGWQWTKWSRVQFESENVGKPMQGHTRTMWERITGMAAERLEDRPVVLDIGCGPGRFVEIARTKGALVIGLDYSNAVEAAARNFAGDHGVCICQADALKLPLQTGVLDGAFSIGVLHHTPSPAAGVSEAFRVLKRGGWFALAVYGKGGYYDFPSVQAWRKLFRATWPVLRHYPPLAYSYFATYALRPVANLSPSLGRVMRLFLPFARLPDVQWSLLDTFDSLTPSYQSAHESYEVYQWLRSVGFAEVEPTDWGFTSYRGVKPSHYSL